MYGYPPELQIFDTGQGIAREPIETSFSFSLDYLKPRNLWLSIEPYGYIPSLDELMIAPFYPDRSQRILAVHFVQRGPCYTINTELLLELAREREGQDVEWDEWGIYTIEVRGGGLGDLSQIRVSGCRLFCIAPDGADNDDSSHLWIYDFSHVGRAKYLCTPDRASEGGGTRQISPSLDGYKLPWNSIDPCDAISTRGHDNTTFCIVSIFIFLFAVE